MPETETDDLPHAARPLSRMTQWPPGVYSVSLDALDRLGVDRDGLLYWDGHLLKMSRKVSLDTQERIMAWTVAGATVVAAIATALQAYATLFTLAAQ